MSRKNLLHYELRNGTVETLLFIVKTTDLDALRAEMTRRFEAAPGFFANEAVAIDVRRLEQQRVAMVDLVALATEFQLKPIAVIAQEAQAEWAATAGLPLVGSPDLRELKAGNRPEGTAGAEVEPEPQPVAEAAQPVVAPVSAQLDAVATMIIDKPLRSGQRIYASGDLVILNVVSYGAEVIAAGNIHIYAPLRGRALAGVHGNHEARIFCTCFEPELVAIAGVYRTAENALPKELQGKPVQIRLDGEKLALEPLQLT